MSVAPISPTAAALRVEILGAAESELIAMLGATPELEVAPTPGPTAGAASPTPKAQALDTARAAAAGRQASLAPLFADLTQALSVPGLPSPIKAAIDQVLALQLPASGPIEPEDVRQAVAQSGLFLEADLAAVRPGNPAPLDLKAALLTLQQALPTSPPPAEAPAAVPQAAPPQQAAPPSRDPASPPQSAAPQTASPQATAPPNAGLQAPAPAAPPANAGPALAQPQPSQIAASASPPLSATPAQVPETPGPPGAAPTAAGETPRPQPSAAAPVPPQDVRQAIAQAALLREADLAPIAPEPPAPRDPKAALLALQQATPAAAPADAPAPAPRAAPPARDAALTPQGVASPTLPKDADLTAVLQHLRPEVEQALARVTLHQLASLPDGSASAWMFELPVATPQGTAIAQFEVDRDGAGSGEAGAAAPWRARFSIDVEPLGPVHVHVAMSAGKAAVSVWAERAGSLERLRDHGAELASALPAEVVFRPGAPGGATPARGHFLDQTS